MERKEKKTSDIRINLVNRYLLNLNYDIESKGIILDNEDNILNYQKEQKIKANFNFYENSTSEKDIIKK